MRVWIGVAWLVASLLALSGTARADPVRILIAVSHARGVEGELPLRHAGEDADHVRDVFAAVGGVGPSTTVRLVDPTVAQLLAAVERARALATQAGPADVTFLLYFSGHGDRDRIHLGTETIPMAELVEQVRGVPAALRIVVTDACRNDPIRTKGVTAEPAFALSGRRSEADGVVWLSASEIGEAAQESDELQGALFTYYWVNGLRGAADANGDGRVTLSESYDFAYSQTLLRSARGSGVLQHPMATYEVTEYSPIVMTQTFGGTTRLEFPPGADTRYLVYAIGSRTVLGELWSRPDHSSVLAVPAGRYVVARRAAGGGTAAAEIALARGEDRVLGPSDFHAVHEEQMASKGGEVVVLPNEFAIELGAGTSRVADSLGHIGLRYAYVFGAWALAFGSRVSAGPQHTSASDVQVASLGLQATAERRWRLGAPVLSLGAGAAADFVMQRVTRADAAQVGPAGYATTANFSALAAGPFAVVRLRLPLGATKWVEAAARGELLFADFDGSTSPLLSAAFGTLGAGFSF
jgi:hypothetical protein